LISASISAQNHELLATLLLISLTLLLASLLLQSSLDSFDVFIASANVDPLLLMFLLLFNTIIPTVESIPIIVDGIPCYCWCSCRCCQPDVDGIPAVDDFPLVLDVSSVTTSLLLLHGFPRSCWLPCFSKHPCCYWSVCCSCWSLLLMTLLLPPASLTY